MCLGTNVSGHKRVVSGSMINGDIISMHYVVSFDEWNGCSWISLEFSGTKTLYFKFLPAYIAIDVTSSYRMFFMNGKT